MSETYQALEGELTVSGADSTVRAGATNAVALVGGYDAANAASGVTAGEATKITDPTNADAEFGTSELARAAAVVSANEVGDIWGIPVAETDATETASATSSISLTETPVFDPSVHPDHDLTVKEDTSGDGTYDTELTVNIVYEDPVSTPSESETANVNPIIGEVETDSSGDYQVSYTHGDYTAAIETAVGESVRYVVVLNEADSVQSTLSTELSSRANDFDFKRGVVGATPAIAPGDASNYTPDTDDWRVIEVAPARATGSDGAVRTAAAVGGLMAAQPIGPDGSGLYDTVAGLTDLNTLYRPSEAKDFSRVTALTENGVIGVAETTSTVSQFKNIYATEIIDDVAADLFGTARNYAGGPQDVGELSTLLEVDCQRHSRGSPPNLGIAGSDARPYDVGVSLDPNDNGIANASVTIVPFPIAEEVNVNLTVADNFVEFQGAN